MFESGPLPVLQPGRGDADTSIADAQDPRTDPAEELQPLHDNSLSRSVIKLIVLWYMLEWGRASVSDPFGDAPDRSLISAMP